MVRSTLSNTYPSKWGEATSCPIERHRAGNFGQSDPRLIPTLGPADRESHKLKPGNRFVQKRQLSANLIYIVKLLSHPDRFRGPVAIGLC